MVRNYYLDEELVFTVTEEPESYRMRVQTAEVEEHHVEEFMDTTVEWLSTKPEKGILIDFTGVKTICADFAVQLASCYENIKRRGLPVRFVNVDPAIEPYIDVSNITVVMSVPVLEKPKVSAKMILEDLSRNLSDKELMKKHGLTSKGLASMFRKLLIKGLITREALAKRLGVDDDEITLVLEEIGSDLNKPIVDASEVLKDIAGNMTDEELMQKYRLSAKGLQSLMMKLYRRGLLSKSTLLTRKRIPK